MKLLKKTLHQQFLEEIEKVKIIAKTQLENGDIDRKMQNLILIKLFEKIECYKKSIDKFEIPHIEIKKYEKVNLLDLIDTLFSFN